MRKFFWIASALLLIAVAAQIAGALLQPRSATSIPHLSQAIPTSIVGWTSREMAVAETEELKKVVEGVLQFDDVLSRSYTNGAHEVTLYAAYWLPGKVPPRSVGVHTPDTCWIQNGWTRLGRDYAVPLTATSGPLKPAERGTYQLRGTVQHVLFWHLVGTTPYAYKQEGLHSITAPLQDLFSFGLEQRQAQLFVRLSSKQPFDEIWSDPGLQTLLASLGRLGLSANPASRKLSFVPLRGRRRWTAGIIDGANRPHAGLRPANDRTRP